jgi:hypothetical protein
MIQKIKLAFWWIFCGFCFGITPYIFTIADMERGYNATGGEIFIPLIPLLAWAMKDSIKEMKGVFKND